MPNVVSTLLTPRLLRRLFDGALVMLLVGVGLVAGLSAIAPLVGHHLFIIRSGSMEPAIPVGALVVVSEKAAAKRLEPGDVVTLRTPSATVVTHRIIRSADVQGERHIETKGDASPTADPVLIPVDWVVGRVILSLPVAGFLLAYLASPLGIMAVVFMAGSLLTAVWVIEDLEAVPDRRGAAVPA